VLQSRVQQGSTVLSVRISFAHSTMGAGQYQLFRAVKALGD